MALDKGFLYADDEVVIWEESAVKRLRKVSVSQE